MYRKSNKQCITGYSVPVAPVNSFVALVTAVAPVVLSAAQTSGVVALDQKTASLAEQCWRTRILLKHRPECCNKRIPCFQFILLAFMLLLCFCQPAGCQSHSAWQADGPVTHSAWQANETLQPFLERTWFHRCSFLARTSSSVRLLDDAIPYGGVHVP